MRTSTAARRLETLGPYDSVYLSPHGHDAAASCASRASWESARGLRILVVTLFASDSFPEADAGPDRLDLGLPPAPQRDPGYASLRAVLYERHAADDACIDQAARALNEIRHRTQARHVYVPLAVGGHADHRVAHDAALRVFHGGAGRDVFLYEDRPYALVPGAVRLRLGQLGVQLPAGAALAARGAGPLRLAAGMSIAPHVRAHARGALDRLSCSTRAFRASWDTRAWHPLRSLGPRVQPVLHEAEGSVAAIAGGVDAAALCGAAALPEAWASRYQRFLGAGPHAERYWLLLPSRERGFTAPAADGADALAS